MAAQKEMMAAERLLVGSIRPHQGDSQLDINVLFTTVRETIHALCRAAEMSISLGARITLLVPQVVPYPYPLSSPPVLLEFNERRFRTIAEASAVETRVRIYLCRDRDQLLEHVLSARSVVVLGRRKHWWPTAEYFLARRLRAAGHEVILTETE